MNQPSGSAQQGCVAAVDLSNCDREPIHIPGAIQPHGLLFAFTGGDLHTVSASANVETACGVAAESLPGIPLGSLFDEPSQARLIEVVRQAEPGSAAPITMRFARRGETAFDAFLHRHDGLVFLELERQSAQSGASHAMARRTSNAIKRLQAAATLPDACFAAASEVREITGFDRVKVYRFGADFSGEVIAEDRCEEVDSFLGLHFPASDIPSQARAGRASCLKR